MNNNRGFTLVELLAVIGIIAVLSIVAISTYRGINESSKKKTLDAKITQINSAAEKWARENNITHMTSISVNALVVEGYISADEVNPDGLAMIKNPVTGENMICNTVEITFSNGVIKTKYNSNIQDCSLAKQSLVDNNINITVVSLDNENRNINLTGSSSMAKWSNHDVEIIVNSSQYDPKATSISYDFEGNTVTKEKSSLQKYTGNTFVRKEDVSKYYNVFYIEGSILLNTKVIVTYTIPGEGTKSRGYTIRIDQEEATATVKSNSEWLTSNSPVTIMIDDGKGSGPSKFYITKSTNFNEAGRIEKTTDYKGTTVNALDVGKYYVWTEDKAGNRSATYKMILEINNVDTTTPECEVLFEGTLGDHGWYKETDVTPYGRNTVPAGPSGMNIGVNMNINDPVYTGFAAYNTHSKGPGTVRTNNTPKNGTPYYCHVKTLAGKYANATKTLYLDKTPPTISVTVDNPTVHERSKTGHITIRDTLSGLNESTTVRYGLATTASGTPGTWHNVNITTTAQNNDAVTEDFTTSDLVTGTYYLIVDTSGFTDYAGNHADSGDGIIFVYGPFKFDNTAPVCDGNNGKTNWTMGGYDIFQKCRDDQGTADQSGCTLPIYPVVYTNMQTVKDDSVTIYDNAGNSTICGYNVYIDNTKPVCGTDNGKTNWTKGTYTVTVNCSDGTNQSGCTQDSYSSFYSDTTRESSITIVDVVGNTKVCPVNVYLDNTPPVCGAVTGESDTWTNRSRTVSVDCQDAHSGCAQTYFSKTHNTSYEYDTIDISDNVGNVTTCGGTKGFKFRVDIDAPMCILRNPGNQCLNTGASVVVYCNDQAVNGGSGMKSIDGGGSLAVSPDGVTDMDEQVYGLTSNRSVYAYDNAGNSTQVDITVYSYMKYKKSTCTAGNTCEEAGCYERNSCYYCPNGDRYYSSGSYYCCIGYTPDDNEADCQIYNAWCSGLSRCGTSIKMASYGAESSCSCKTYNASIDTCGCANWDVSDYSYDVKSCNGADANHCLLETETVYSITPNYCHN